MHLLTFVFKPFIQVAEAATDDSLRLGLEALDTGVLTVVPPLPKPKDVEPEPQKEPVKIPMPPTKPSPLPNLQITIPDTTDSDVQAPQAPSPPSKSLKESIYAREKLMSENEQTNKEENSVLRVHKNESTENLNKVLSSPPKPPPKILSEKMKIKWVGSSSDLMEKEDIISEERGSKENLVDFESDELESPSIIQQEESLEDLHAKEKSSSLNSLQEASKSLSECTDNMDTDKGAFQEACEESVFKSNTNDEKNEADKNVTLASDVQEHDSIQPTEEKRVRYIKHKKKTGFVTIHTHHIQSKVKASSMGDLLSATNETDMDSTMIHLTKDHLDQVEMNLACGKERTKTLLNQIVKGQLGKTTEGNGVECNPETLLNDLMAQLQEASEVLQEIKEKEPRNGSNASDVGTDRQKEKRKELMALQRRSVPF